MARRGRKRKQGVRREPNGRASRVHERQDMKSVVIEARMRRYRIPKDAADSQEGGTVLGRLLLGKKITRNQFDAGFCYGLTLDNYHRVCGIQHPSPRAMEMFRVGGFEGEETEDQQERTERATAASMELDTLLKASGQHGPQISRNVWKVCFMNEDPEDMPLLISGLNILAGFYQITQQ